MKRTVTKCHVKREKGILLTSTTSHDRQCMNSIAKAKLNFKKIL